MSRAAAFSNSCLTGSETIERAVFRLFLFALRPEHARDRRVGGHGWEWTTVALGFDIDAVLGPPLWERRRCVDGREQCSVSDLAFGLTSTCDCSFVFTSDVCIVFQDGQREFLRKRKSRGESHRLCRLGGRQLAGGRAGSTPSACFSAFQLFGGRSRGTKSNKSESVCQSRFGRDIGVSRLLAGA